MSNSDNRSPHGRLIVTAGGFVLFLAIGVLGVRVFVLVPIRVIVGVLALAVPAELTVDQDLIAVKAGLKLQDLIIPQQLAQAVGVPAAFDAVQGKAELHLLAFVRLVDDGAEHFLPPQVSQDHKALITTNAAHIVEVNDRRLHHAVKLNAPTQGLVLIASALDVLTGVIWGGHDVGELQHLQSGFILHRKASLSAPRRQAPG